MVEAGYFAKNKHSVTFVCIRWRDVKNSQALQFLLAGLRVQSVRPDR